MKGRLGAGLVSGATMIALLLCGCVEQARTVTIDLWHCGISPLTVDGRTWELPDPKFDAASTLPDDFSGHGSVTVHGDTLVYVDDLGHRLVFLPDEAVPPPPPCA